MYGFHQQMGRSLNCQCGFCQESARDLQVWKQLFMHLSQQALICHEDINHPSVGVEFRWRLVLRSLTNRCVGMMATDLATDLGLQLWGIIKPENYGFFLWFIVWLAGFKCGWISKSAVYITNHEKENPVSLQMDIHLDYPLVNVYIAIENCPVEIVSFPMNSMVIFQFVMYPLVI